MSKKLEKEIEELKKRIEELEGKDKTPTELPFWMPKEGEVFYHIDSEGDLCSSNYSSVCLFDQSRFSIGNYFCASELAQKHVDKLKLLEKIKQWRRKYDPESFKLTFKDYRIDLVYDPEGNKWDWLDFSDDNCKHPLAISFSVVDRAKQFIEHFGNRLDILLEVD